MPSVTVRVFMCINQAQVVSAKASIDDPSNDLAIIGSSDSIALPDGSNVPVFRRFPRSVGNLLDPADEIADVVIVSPAITAPTGEVYSKPVLVIAKAND